MRLIFALALCLTFAALGCGRSQPTIPNAGESPERSAARVFALAQKMERDGKSKEAFAAYHQIVRNFANTLSGQQAAARIQQAQREAARKALRKKSAATVRKGSD